MSSDSAIQVFLHPYIAKDYSAEVRQAVENNQADLLMGLDHDRIYGNSLTGECDGGFQTMMYNIKISVLHRLIRDNIGSEVYGTAFTQAILDYYETNGRWPKLKIDIVPFEERNEPVN